MVGINKPQNFALQRLYFHTSRDFSGMEKHNLVRNYILQGIGNPTETSGDRKAVQNELDWLFKKLHPKYKAIKNGTLNPSNDRSKVITGGTGDTILYLDIFNYLAKYKFNNPDAKMLLDKILQFPANQNIING